MRGSEDGAYKTVRTTSRSTSPLGNSIFSSPGRGSARVGPTLSMSTGFFNSRACLRSLEGAVNIWVANVKHNTHLNAE